MVDEWSARKPVRTLEPLTHVQRQLWLAERIGGGRNVYGVPFIVELKGHLDQALVSRCVTEITRRHEILRARVVEHGDEQGLVVEEPGPVPVELVDLRGDAVRLERELEEAAREPIDLAATPLLRVRLWRVTADEELLFIHVHHLAFDGWSLGIFWKEFVELYNAWSQGRRPELTPLRTTAIECQRQRAQLRGSGAYDDQVRYWESRLADPPNPAVLPRDLPAPAIRQNPAGDHRITVPRETFTKLRTVARRLRTTPFVMTLTVWSLLLSRWSGRGELVIGSPLSGRTLPGEDELIGMFLNTVPLLVRVEGDQTVGELVARLRTTTLEALANQDVVHEVVERAREGGGTPLFRSVFSYETAAGFGEAPAGLRVTSVREVPRGHALFDIGVDLLDVLGELRMQIEYDTELFSGASVSWLADQFVALLDEALDHPRTPVRELTGVSDAELRTVRSMSGAPVWPEPEATAHGIFEEQARRTPDAVAAIDGDTRLSYAALDSRANRLANRLRQRGAGPEARIGIALGKGIRWAVAILAVLKAGGGYVPLVPATGRERLARLVADADPLLVITDTAAHGLFVDGLPVVNLDDPATERLLEETPDTGLAYHVGGAALAYVPYTSGSTGEPKGVLVSHTNLASFARAAVTDYELSAEDIFVQLAAMSFDVHVEEMLPVWAGGGAVAFSGIDLSRTLPSELFTELTRTGATVCELTTAYWLELVRTLDAGDVALPPRLRLVLVGGERAPTEALRRWESSGARMINVYGLTETAVTSTIYKPAGRSPGEWLPVGSPMAHASVHVLDDSLRPVGVGQVGEVFIGGPGVARGALGRPSATAERFLPDPFSLSRGARMYQTGDSARWLPSGDLEFVGRLDDQVKIRGHRVEPSEVAAALEEHPEVHRCVIVVDRAEEPQLLAYVVASVDEETLSRHARARMPNHLVPTRVVVVDALPLTGHGKVDVAALPQPGGLPRHGGGEEIGTELQTRLAEIYREVLNVPSIGLTESIFDLGAHSLLALRLVNRVQREFGCKLSLVNFFRESTIRALSEYLESETEAS